VSGCPHRDDAGPWVLGALDDADTRAFAAHLERCEGCRAEVAALQPVADVLPMAAPQELPPPALKDRIMAVVESEAALLGAASGAGADAGAVGGAGADRSPGHRHRRGRRQGRPAWLRPVPVGVLVAVVVAIGVATVVLVGGGEAERTFTGFGPDGASVALHVDDDHGRLELLGMPQAPEGHVYQVWLVTGTAQPRATRALFTVPADGRARVEIPEPLDGADQVLVTAEPPGGSPQPTSSPVAGAKLA